METSGGIKERLLGYWWCDINGSAFPFSYFLLYFLHCFSSYPVNIFSSSVLIYVSGGFSPYRQRLTPLVSKCVSPDDGLHNAIPLWKRTTITALWPLGFRQGGLLKARTSTGRDSRYFISFFFISALAIR